MTIEEYVEGSNTMTTETSAELNVRKELEERLWNKQWAMDKSIEWSKHVNELISDKNSSMTGDVIQSGDVMGLADRFYQWLYKDTK
jgi:hypothetical protein